MKPKNTICLWFDTDALEAAQFYAATFPDSKVTAVHNAPSDYPSGKEGDVLTVEFTVAGIPCLGLNGGPGFKHNEASSFQIATDDQEETDGSMSKLGRCSGRYGEDLILVVVDSHGRIPSGEQVAQRPVESFGSGLQEPVGALLRPLHLLFFGKTPTDHEVDGGFNEGGRDPLAGEPAFTVV